MTEIKRPLKVFLYHAPVDKVAARELYLRLIKDGVDAWLVKDRLLPGQDWKEELDRAVSEADVVVACVSNGWKWMESRQKEVQAAFDAILSQHDREMFVILVRLDEHDRLENLENWQWVDLFAEGGYEMLLLALQARASQIGAILQPRESSLPQLTTPEATGEHSINEEKPVKAGQTIVEIGEGASILMEQPAMTVHGLLQHKLRRAGVLVLIALVGSLAAIMIYYAQLQREHSLAPTLSGKPTQPSAPATKFSPEPIPIPTLVRRGTVSHMVFLIDTSGSMQGQRIRNVTSAASKFVSRLGDDYLVSVIQFNTKVELRMASTRDHAAASEIIQSITVDVEHNGSCIQDALYAAGYQESLHSPTADAMETIIIVLNDVALGDHLEWNCGTRATDDSIIFTLSFPTPVFSIYVGNDFLENSFAVSSGWEGASRPAQSVQKIEETLLLIAQAAGLAMDIEAATPDPNTDAMDVPMVFVPPGEFLIGSGTPVHLDAFWIDKTEVTNAMYSRCVQAGQCSAPRSNGSHMRANYFGNPEFDNYPVIYVSWEDANSYCAWIGGRLPTETEWEKAARGTDGRQFPWGDQDPAGIPNFLNYQAQDTTEVGSFPNGASPYGALDMAGNVSEWVADWYSPDYYNNPPASNPQGPASGEYRVWRGGSWANTSTDLVTTYARTGNLPTDASGGIGFRCARNTSL